jgi:hypothetical protein
VTTALGLAWKENRDKNRDLDEGEGEQTVITLDQIEGSAWRAWNALKSLHCDFEFFDDIDAQERAQLKEEIRAHLEFYADLCERFDTTDTLIERSERAMREIDEQRTLRHRGY